MDGTDGTCRVQKAAADSLPAACESDVCRKARRLRPRVCQLNSSECIRWEPMPCGRVRVTHRNVVPGLPHVVTGCRGSPAASHAARPPANSLTRSKPCCCSRLAAIDDRYPPAQCTSSGRPAGSSCDALRQVIERELTGFRRCASRRIRAASARREPAAARPTEPLGGHRRAEPLGGRASALAGTRGCAGRLRDSRPRDRSRCDRAGSPTPARGQAPR